MNQIGDLKTFLQALKERDLLFTTEKEVDWNHEIGSLIATLEPSGRAGYFPHVKDKQFGVCGNLLGSMDSIAVALGCEKEEITDFLAKCLDRPIKPQIVESAPCQAYIQTGDQVDVTKLPVPVHAPKDGGPIITGGVIVSKELHGTRQNLSFQRMHVKGKDKISIMINEWRHLKDFYNEAEAEGKPLPIAISIGADPVVYVGAGLRYDGDEMEIAGAIRGRPMQVVKCITNDIYVPAESQFVIEGEILPNTRELEGPLGEFTRWTSPSCRFRSMHPRMAAPSSPAASSYPRSSTGPVRTSPSSGCM